MGEISSLAKQVAKSNTSTDNGTLMYGTVADGGVRLDGASVVTPATFAVEAKAGERVMCRILNHTVTVTSNVTDPSAGTEKVEEISGYALDAHNILVKIADDKTEADEIVEAIQGKFAEANDAAAEAKESADKAIADAATANAAATEATLYAKDALDKAGVATQAAKDASTAKDAAQKSADDAAEALNQAGASASKAQAAQEAVTEAVNSIQNTVVESEDQFYLSTSSATPTGGEWKPNATWEAGKYLWTRTRCVLYMGKTEYRPSETGVCITGNTGSKGEDAAVVRIDSSRGTVFKNAQVATVLTVHVHYGAQVIEDKAALVAAFGAGAYLEWQWQKIDDDSWGIIPSSDARISNDGFSLTLTPDDVDVKTNFQVILNS